MKSVYFYDEKTKEYSYEGYAQLDPLESEIQGREIYLLPANATFEKPFEKKDGWTQFWEDEKWMEIEDFREKEYWPSGSSFYDSPIKMKEVGPLPEGATLTRPEKTEEELEIERLIKAKSERADYVSKIIVEVDGMQFDGDETSQDRMARSVVALNDDEETVQWVLADNTIAQVTRVQLKQALRLAGEAQTAIWANPYITI